jgi:transcriptional regulator with XRE-family HTH domain
VTGAEAIREARVKAGLTQAQLAELLGRDRAQVARWEIRGQEPSFENVVAAIEACGYALRLERVERAQDPELDAELEEGIDQAPQQRVQALLDRLPSGP